MGFKAFLEGGIASIIAGAVTHPLDLIKVRMQLHGEFSITLENPNPNFAPLKPHRPIFALNSLIRSISLLHSPTNSHVPHPTRVNPFSVGAHIVRSEGPGALFSGVSATVLRQMLYSATRIGIYDILKKKWTNPTTGNFPLGYKIAAGLIAGALGAAVGNPADVAMVRMQADGRLPAYRRRNYKSVFDALDQIVKHEGFGSLWRGSCLTVNRAMIVTASQLATYDHVKEAMAGDGIGTHVVASFVAGFVAAVASNPVDVVKTRMMSMRVAAGGAAPPPPYSGTVECVVKMVRAEGPMALYKGFVPTITRQGPFTVVLFVTLEHVRKILNHVKI